ncbi:NAD(P)-dependent oxidoreductase [Paenibacillus nasutitermitis]|uniref:6-phosphogluconate dehydrogenase n=1 Tax=Paenibacillus nasutitermitis TaxID=1652958 RepID=A0A917DYY0_9BACL|nr:NAD(P)-binding domain-containing protein [Paenibacillus nasutitermitis]GGD80755.1 6-phosphogluconate dehydrogenase [Paenibacillus nasutitermitis]
MTINGQFQQTNNNREAQTLNRAPVTVLGLGPMGHALAGALLKAGHPTTVWNRSAGKADALTAQGAILAETVTEAVAASPLTIVCVLDYDAVHAIVGPLGDALRGRTLVNLTADSPIRARQSAEWAAGHGIEYLDGAIMTPTTSIGQSSAVVLYSGSEAVYQAHRQTFASIGGTSVHLGEDPGRAAAYDVSLLDIFWTSMSGYIHALTLAKAENISAKELLPFAQGISSILPDIMAALAEQVDNGQYPGNGSNLLSAATSMEHIIDTAHAHGIDTRVLIAANDIAKHAIDAGHGTDGFALLTEVLRKKHG